MNKCLFSAESVGLIYADCFSSGNVETGGVLIRPKNQKLVVTDIITSTDFAERSQYTYYQSEEDVEAMNSQLRQFQQRGYDFSGYYHLHPPGMSQLSHGDMQTAIEILKSPSYKLNNFLLMSIVTAIKGQFPIYVYGVALKNENQLAIKKLDVHILPKKCIQEFVEGTQDEPILEGERCENIHSGQDSKRIEKPTKGNSVRIQRKGGIDNKLPKKGIHI